MLRHTQMSDTWVHSRWEFGDYAKVSVDSRARDARCKEVESANKEIATDIIKDHARICNRKNQIWQLNSTSLYPRTETKPIAFLSNFVLKIGRSGPRIPIDSQSNFSFDANKRFPNRSRYLNIHRELLPKCSILCDSSILPLSILRT